MKHYFTTLELAALILTSVVASAQNHQANIEHLEHRLAIAKSDQQQLQKEVTEAALSLPDFYYRPGGGLTIQAVDRAWSVNFGFEVEMRMLFGSKRVDFDFNAPQSSNQNGQILLRRFRPQFSYCVNNCFYETNISYNNDRFVDDSQLHRGEMQVHLEQVTPWLPTVRFGIRGQMPVSYYRQGSTLTGAQSETDLLSRNIGLETGSYNNGLVLDWNDIKIPSGRAQFHVGMGQFGDGVDGLSRISSRKDVAIYGRIEPFSKTGIKWLEGLGVENMHWWCANTLLISIVNGAPPINRSVCGSLTINNPGNYRQESFFQFFPGGVPSVRSMNHYQLIGAGWRLGPYVLRAIRGWQDFDFVGEAPFGDAVDAKGRNFLIANELFLWSPKGWFTGEAETPGSLLLGTHFERVDVSCGRKNCASGGEFSRNRIRLKEWGLRYFLLNKISVGASVRVYDASNLRSGRNRPQETLACSGLGRSIRGKNCGFTDGNLSFRMSF